MLAAVRQSLHSFTSKTIHLCLFVVAESDSLNGKAVRDIRGTNLHNREFKGALSRQFCCFPINPSFLPLLEPKTWPRNHDLRLKNQSIFFYKKSNPWYIFGFALKMVRELWKIAAKFLKIDLSPSLPSATTESSKW